MTLHDPADPDITALTRGCALAPALFAATLFASALLLFAVQPMFTKMVLPMLGGAPSVWSVAMVFFQGALLAGYAYAHLLARTLDVGQAALVHLGVLAAAALTLPIGIAQGFGAPPSTGVGALAGRSVRGLDRAAVRRALGERAAAAKLVRGERPRAGAQSLCSLCGLEPRLVRRAARLSAGARVVLTLAHAGVGVVGRLCGACGAHRRRRDGRGARKRRRAMSLTPPRRRRHGATRAAWTALAAIPAGLVIAVTAYISTDIAAAPLLWVLPLALYLLTFVAVFRDRPWFSHDLVAARSCRSWWRRSRSRCSAATAYTGSPPWRSICWRCSCWRSPATAKSIARRPAPALLTEFYLWTSFGGVHRRHLRWAARAASVQHDLRVSDPRDRRAARAAGRAAGPRARVPLAHLPGHRRRLLAGFLTVVDRLPAAGGIGLDAAGRARRTGRPDAAAAARSGALRGARGVRLRHHRAVAAGPAPDRADAQLLRRARVVETIRRHAPHAVHGNTIHGAERMRDADGTPVTGRPEPLTYYYFGGPISEVTAAARAARQTE